MDNENPKTNLFNNISQKSLRIDSRFETCNILARLHYFSFRLDRSVGFLKYTYFNIEIFHNLAYLQI